MKPLSTSRPSSGSRLLAFCTPKLWIEGSESVPSSAIDHGQQNALGRYVVQVLVVVLAYFIAGKLGQATTSIRSSNLGPVWPAYGIALSSLLLYGYPAWIGVAVGAFLVAFLSPVSHLAALGQAAGATFAALTGAFLLRRVADFHSSLSRLRDAIGLIVFGAFGSAMVSASVGVSSLQATHVKAYFGAASAWVIYWLGDSTGVLLVTPLILTLPSLLRIRSRASIGELATLLTFLIATCFVLFGHLSPIQVKFHVLAFAVLPFVMWAAIKFGTGGASLSVLVTATIATVETACGQGPFAGNTSFTNAVLLDVFFSVLALTGLTLSAVIAERDEAARKLTEEKLREYKNAVEGSEEMIAVVDREYRYVIANRKFLEYRNMTKDQVVGRLVPEVLNKGVFEEEVKEKLDRCFAGDVVRYEMNYTYPGLGERDLFISYFPIEGPAGVDRVACILQDVTERKRIEEALRESEERLHLAVRAGRMYAFEWDPETDVILRSGECAAILNWMDNPTLDTSRQFATCVHPDDREAYANPETVLTPGSPTYQTNYRVLRPDGSVVWLEACGHAVFSHKGKMLRIIGMVADVTERRRAERELSELGGRLIHAQEEERTRIARELHDDFNQRMALLQISLEQIARDNPLSSKTRQQLLNITKTCAEVSSSLHDLSHQLHPHKLDMLGLVAALSGFCNDFSRQHNLRVQFIHQDVPEQIPKDVTLCLFRIVQEALRNVVKHSGAEEARVELIHHNGQIDLCVSDSGAGFRSENVTAEAGLGLISMRERLRLVRGHLSVESESSNGTQIRVRVPLFTSKPGVTGEGKAHTAGA